MSAPCRSADRSNALDGRFCGDRKVTDDVDLEWEWFRRDFPNAGNRNDPDPTNEVWPVYERWRQQKAAEVAQVGPEVMFEELNNRLEQEIATAVFQLRAHDEDLQQRESSLRQRIADGEANLQEQAHALEAIRSELREQLGRAQQAFDGISPEVLTLLKLKQEGETELQYRLRTGKHSNEQ